MNIQQTFLTAKLSAVPIRKLQMKMLNGKTRQLREMRNTLVTLIPEGVINHFLIKVVRRMYHAFLWTWHQTGHPQAYYKARTILDRIRRVVLGFLVINALVMIIFSTAVFRSEPREGMEFAAYFGHLIVLFLDLYCLSIIVKCHTIVRFIERTIDRIDAKFYTDNGS